MKTLLKTSLITSMMLSSLLAQTPPDTDEGWHSHRPSLALKEKIEEKAESKKRSLEILDKVLSPFEDMTEYALAKDTSGMKKGYKNILSMNRSGILKQSVSEDTYQKVTSKLIQLEQNMNTHNYSNVALLSTELFTSIVNDFNYATYIKNQLHIENLDGMGFELLSLVSAKHIDYNKLHYSIVNAKKDWIVLRKSINDKNLKESFDLLLRGLAHASIKEDKEMIKILASMDLALVDVLEQQFK